MARGRSKGQTKKCVYIQDPLLGDYKIQVDEHCYIPMRSADEKALAYCSNMNAALKYVVKQNLVAESAVFTIEEYIETTNKLFNELNEKINF